jgi:uncharacterized protein YijF (DUF1287 family)
MKKQRKVLILVLMMIIMIFSILVLSFLNIIPKRIYRNADFDIEQYISENDEDLDGVDDQSDILMSVREYIATKPKYKSKYYGSGYPDDQYGVCTDVVAYGLLGAGYDLRELLDVDIKENREYYDIDTIDKNIDFRRVRNLKVFFDRYAQSLTTNVYEIDQWQGGDIIVFEKHIGIVSDKRNKKGIPYLIHHANPYQLSYEEDILEHRQDIIGHYRILSHLIIIEP